MAPAAATQAAPDRDDIPFRSGTALHPRTAEGRQVSSELVEAALMYADMGMAVIPLHGKRPIFPNWPEIATKDKSLITRWWQQNPSANVGVATGRKSGVFVVDIDPRHGGDQTWQEKLMEHAFRPNTWQDMTGGGGMHVFFRCPTFPVKSCSGLLPGIDIRGEGGQVVVPPSVHPDTHRTYEWDGMAALKDQQLGEAPQWLLDLLQPVVDHSKNRLELPARIPHGTQHHTLLAFAGALRRMGLNADEILPSLMKVNESRCQKPGPEKNIRAIAQSMMRYQPHEKDLWSQATKLWKLTAAAEREQMEKLASMRPVSAYDLFNREPEAGTMLIEDCLHQGCTILAGPPKCGKSWLTLGIGISVATGGVFIGARKVLRPGRVAYWALEESERRTAARLKSLTDTRDITLQNLDFFYDIPTVDQLLTYCSEYHPDLIVIDTLMAFVTRVRSSHRDVFRDDYREIKTLADLAKDQKTAVLVVHHTSKTGGDTIGAVAGSHGVTAAADCVWKITRQPQKRATLEITGREIEDQAFLMELDIAGQVGWRTIEEGEDVQLSGERQIVLEVLREKPNQTPKQIGMEIGKTPPATRKLLQRMTQAGLIVKNTNGNYRLAEQKEQNKGVWYDRD